MNLEKIGRDLAAKKFVYLKADDWPLTKTRPQAWKDLAASWDRLASDQYMKAGDTFRERRFCKFIVDSATMSFTELDDFGFYQTAALNPYAGDKRREFEPVEPSIRKNTVLREIVQTCLHAILFLGDRPARFWKVYVHQFRINCTRSLTGLPTPEGVHRDGHDFISMHLMDRVRVEGGSSHICDRTGHSLMSVMLENRMDGFLIDDSAVLHGVSPIRPSMADSGHRDMLVIDYNRDA